MPGPSSLRARPLSTACLTLSLLVAVACGDDAKEGRDTGGVLVPDAGGVPGGGTNGGPGGTNAGPGGTNAGPGGTNAGPGGTNAGPGGTNAGPGGANDAGGSTGNPRDGGGAAAGSDASGQAGAGGATAGVGDGGGGGGMPAGPGPGDAQRVDNPYAGAKGYVNPEWRAKAMAESGGARIAETSTAVWIDRIAAINGTAGSVSNGPMGVRDHLNAALSQGAGYIQFVIYNLPGRDCSALASNGELGTTDLPRYKTEYIDPIAAIMGDAKYRPLRIINVIEVDSLPNLITNLDVAKCTEMRNNGGYEQGIAYALSKLGALPNTYNYIDAGHHGWLGWETNFNPTADLFKKVATAAGMANVHGFITNTANYSALQEPFLDPNGSVNGMQLKMAKWLDFNPYVDELSFAQAFRQKLVSSGFPAGIGMLIDTSRNGWGGASRPTAKSSSTDLNTFVNQSRIDRRIHAGNWCNQSGAGIGERPKASPAAGIDAYVWIKPPGESDGASRQIENNEGKGFDRMCDPTYGGNTRNGNSQTGALADSPLAGAWFSAQFQELLRNAYPAL